MGLTRTERLVLGGIALATAAAAVAHYAGAGPVLAFVIAGVALAGQAWMVSFATEQVGERLGPSATGFMQSTLGNLPELFVVIFALQKGEVVVAQTSIIGSLLANALLVLGLVIVVGARSSEDRCMKPVAEGPSRSPSCSVATETIHACPASASPASTKARSGPAPA